MEPQKTNQALTLKNIKTSLTAWKTKPAIEFDLKLAIQSKTETLATVNKLMGPVEVRKHLLVYLANLEAFIGADFPERALDNLAELIYKKAYYFNLAEVEVLFNHLKTRKYFTRSANEVLQYLDEFIDERLDTAETISQEHHHEIKTGAEVLDDEFITKFYEDRKRNPVVKDAKDRKRDDDAEFRKFAAEYERTKRKGGK